MSHREWCVYACVCVCVLFDWDKAPLTLMLLPPPAPPTWCRGMMPHPPGVCCPRAVCFSSLSVSLWLLPRWKTELVWPGFFVISSPNPYVLPPHHTHTQSELLVPALTPHSTNQAMPCLLIVLYPSDSQRGAYGILGQNSMLIGQRDPL